MNDLEKFFKFVSDKIILDNTVEFDGYFYRFKFWIGGKYNMSFVFRFDPPSTLAYLDLRFDLADPNFDPLKFAMWFESHVCGVLGAQEYVEQKPWSFVRVFVREHYSEKLVKGSVFCDDLSLFLSTTYDVGNGSGRGIFFRRDVEGVIGKIGGFVDPVMLASSVEGYIKLAGGFESIVTDRLHFGIAGLLCRRKVLLCRNSYFKNLGVWEASLREFGCQFDV